MRASSFGFGADAEIAAHSTGGRPGTASAGGTSVHRQLEALGEAREAPPPPAADQRAAAEDRDGPLAPPTGASQLAPSAAGAGRVSTGS